ncbi:MAG: hypothetical protein ACOCRK_02415 [bacterium]
MSNKYKEDIKEFSKLAKKYGFLGIDDKPKNMVNHNESSIFNKKESNKGNS